MHSTPRHHMRKSEPIIASSKQHKMRNCVIPRQRATNHNRGVREVHDVLVLDSDPVSGLCGTLYLGFSGNFALSLGLGLPGREALGLPCFTGDDSFGAKVGRCTAARTVHRPASPSAHTNDIQTQHFSQHTRRTNATAHTSPRPGAPLRPCCSTLREVP